MLGICALEIRSSKLKIEYTTSLLGKVGLEFQPHTEVKNLYTH